MPPNTLSVNWRVVDGFEEVDALLNHATEGTEGPGGLTIGVARDIGVLDRADTLRGLKLDGAPVTEPITVGGRPATLEQLRLADSSGASKWLLRWQPVNGLWVRINVGGHVSRDEVLGMADLLRRLLGTARPSAGFE